MQFPARRPPVRPLFLAAIGISVFSVLLSGAPPEEKRISIFSTVASYSLPVVDTGGREYTGLLEVLEPLGSISAKTDKKRWRLRYNNADLEFDLDKTRVKMRDGTFELGDPFVMQNGRGFVPVSSLGPLLARILGGPVAFSPTSRRIFIGDTAVHFTAQVSGANPPRLVVTFSAPVNPTIATDSGKLRMTFTHEPVVSSGTQTLTFSNGTITSATYQDGNGNAAITVAGNGPLFANFSNDRRTITVGPAPPAAIPTPGPGGQAERAEIQAPAAQSTPAPLTYFAVVDAGHGGEDRGAALVGQLIEKDINLAFARRLQQEIEVRGLTTLLLRKGDTDLSLDQRAAMTNAAHPSVYICIHVTSQGNGMSLYTSLLPVGNQPRGSFLNWDTAQASSLTRSQAALAILAASFENSKIPIRKLAAPLRPLNNITTAAIAIEIAPDWRGASRLDSPEYQQLIASIIATGIAAVHEKMGTAP